MASGACPLPPSPSPRRSTWLGKEEYAPKPEVYDSDDDYPGKDFEFLGVRSLEGVPVVHLIIYLAQYKPLSGVLSVVKTMTIEVSYDVPPQTDAVPQRHAHQPALADMILDFENVAPLQPGPEALDEDAAHDSPSGHGCRRSPNVYGLSPGPRTMPGIATDDTDAVLKRTDIACEYVIITSDAPERSRATLASWPRQGWPHYAQHSRPRRPSQPNSPLPISKSPSGPSWPGPGTTGRNRCVMSSWLATSMSSRCITGRSGERTASDHYYADIRDNLSPEIVVSRLPTSDPRVCSKSANAWRNMPISAAPTGAAGRTRSSLWPMRPTPINNARTTSRRSSPRVIASPSFTATPAPDSRSSTR